MAKFALVNEYVALNSTDLSDRVVSATLTIEAEGLDSTTMGVTWKEMIAGLKSAELEIEWADDVADSEIDDTLWSLFGTVVSFEVRADAGSVSSSNPKYTGNVLINQHSIGGQVGELAKKSTTFPTSGAVSRAES
jgi:hypothetical protein